MPSEKNVHGDTATIALHVTMKFKPEHDEEFVAFAADVVKKVQEQEPGALTYAMYKHPTEANTYIWIERYRDEAALEAHMKMPYMVEAMQKLPGWLAAPPEMLKYQQVLPR